MCEEVKKFIDANDRFGKLTGVELIEIGVGYAKGRLVVRDELLNSVDTVHGGAIFTLADVVFAAASNSHGKVSVAANVNICYMNATRAGVLTAEAEEVSRGNRIAHYTVTVSNENGEKVALFQGMAYIIRHMDMPPSKTSAH